MGKLKDYNFKPKNNWTDLLISLLPILIIVALWIFIMRRMSAGGAGGGGQIFNIGKSKARLFDEKTDIKTTFKDEPDLKAPKKKSRNRGVSKTQKYTNLGGKIPKELCL
jgi:cell division protease FtsH